MTTTVLNTLWGWQ